MSCGVRLVMSQDTSGSDPGGAPSLTSLTGSPRSKEDAFFLLTSPSTHRHPTMGSLQSLLPPSLGFWLSQAADASVLQPVRDL